MSLIGLTTADVSRLFLLRQRCSCRSSYRVKRLVQVCTTPPPSEVMLSIFSPSPVMKWAVRKSSNVFPPTLNMCVISSKERCLTVCLLLALKQGICRRNHKKQRTVLPADLIITGEIILSPSLRTLITFKKMSSPVFICRLMMINEEKQNINLKSRKITLHKSCHFIFMSLHGPV